MRWIAAAILTTIIALLAACGDSQAISTPTPEQELRTRAELAYATSENSDWAGLYTFTSPRSRDTCESSQYAANVQNFADIIRGFMGIDISAPLDFRVNEVQLAGEEAEVFINYWSNGVLIPIMDEGRRRWVKLDGEWWAENEAWKSGCVGWKLFDQP